jgi:hypothetical protein
MAYGELYHFEYRDFLGRLTEVKIFRDGFTGSSTEILEAGEPIIIESKTDDNYLFSQLYGSTCQLNLVSETNMQYADLFSANAFKHKIEIWKEPEPDETQLLFWTGFILPDQYAEPLDFVKNYVVSLTARDAIGALKEIDFVQPSKNRYVGKAQVIRIIAECLKKTQLNIPINFSVNIEEIYAPEGLTGDPLENIYIDYAAFYQKDTDEKIQNTEYVLKQVLQSFGCRLVQSWGEWWIERIPLYYSSHTVFKYTFEGVYVSQSVVNPTKVYTGKYNYTNNRLFFVYKQGRLEINPAFKGFQIDQDFGKLPSILKNYNFKIGRFDYAYNPPFSYLEPYYYPENWTPASNYPAYAPAEWDDILKGIKFINGNYIVLSSQGIQLTLTANKKLNIQFDIYYKTLGNLRLEIVFNNKWCHLQGTEGEEVTFENSRYENVYQFGSSVTSPFKINFTINTNASGYFYIKLGGNDVTIKEVIAKFIDQQNVEYPENALYDVIIDTNNNEKPDKIESILGDLPGLTDAEDIYIGGYWFWNGFEFIPTSSWEVITTDRKLSLMAILAEAINDQYITPKHRISGTLIGNFDFNKSLLIGFMTNKIYLPNRLSLSDKYCKWQAEMIELLPVEIEGSRVLATQNIDEVIATYDNKLIKV